MMTCSSEPLFQGFTHGELLTWFSYEPETGIVRWLRRRGGRCAVGGPVGSVGNHGYLETKLTGRSLLVHRLIWFLVTKEVPPQWVDHEDLDRLNNRWSNLRSAKPAENAVNRGLNKNNKSGFKGVRFNERMGRWHAKIGIDRASKHLGHFNTVTEAALAYNFAARQHFGEFAKLNDIPGLGRVSVPLDSIDLYI